MNAFVTGATTLIGANLIRALRWEGHKVAALVHSSDRHRLAFHDPGVRIVDGAVEDCERWIDELEEVDVLFHAHSRCTSVSHLRLDQDTEYSPVATFTTSSVLGPGDNAATPLGRWVLEFLHTGTVQMARGGACVADARDVAIAMMNAAFSRASGEFVVAGPYVEYIEILGILQDLTGTEARPGGHVELSPMRPIGSARATAELGVSFRPVQETLRDVVSWCRSKDLADLVA